MFKSIRKHINATTIGSFFVFWAAFVVMFWMILMQPRRPQCLGDLDTCAPVLGRSAEEAILTSTLSNWILIVSLSFIIVFVTLATSIGTNDFSRKRRTVQQMQEASTI